METLFACASERMHEYLDWVTSADPSTIGSTDRIAILVSGFHCSLQRWPIRAHTRGELENAFGVLIFLLKRGISPNDVLPVTYRYLPNMMLPFPATVWEHAVFEIFISYLAGAASAGWLIQEFLERGANPDIRLELRKCTLHHPNLEKMVATEEIERVPTMETDDVTFNASFKLGNFFGNDMTEGRVLRFGWEARRYNVRFVKSIAAKGGEITFEDVVEYHDYESKEAILALCARNRRALATGLDTVQQTDVDETQNLETPDCTREKGDQEPNTEPHGSQLLELEVPPTTHGESPSKLAAQAFVWCRRLCNSRIFDVALGKSPPTLVWGSPQLGV
jgi:hypothetical protein